MSHCLISWTLCCSSLDIYATLFFISDALFLFDHSAVFDVINDSLLIYFLFIWSISNRNFSNFKSQPVLLEYDVLQGSVFLHKPLLYLSYTTSLLSTTSKYTNFATIFMLILLKYTFPFLLYWLLLSQLLNFTSMMFFFEGM